MPETTGRAKIRVFDRHGNPESGRCVMHCSACDGNHHWLPGSYDPDAPEGCDRGEHVPHDQGFQAWYVCKHCEAWTPDDIEDDEYPPAEAGSSEIESLIPRVRVAIDRAGQMAQLGSVCTPERTHMTDAEIDAALRLAWLVCNTPSHPHLTPGAGFYFDDEGTLVETSADPSPVTQPPADAHDDSVDRRAHQRAARGVATRDHAFMTSSRRASPAFHCAPIAGGF